MFTGIIQKQGIVASNRGSRLRLRAGLARLRPGASVAVNGVCLTAARRAGTSWEFDVSPETLRLTNLGGLRAGDKVNLELPLRGSDFVGGHFVSGHVDACAPILQRKILPGGFLRLRVALPTSLRKLVAYKGSIAIDGVSLTVTMVKNSYFETVLIPETIKRTTLALRNVGDHVNLETDLIARHVVKILSLRRPSNGPNR